MMRVLRFFGWLALFGALVGIGLVLACAVWGDALLAHTVIEVGDDRVVIDGLNGLSATGALIGAGAVILAAIVVMLVLPVAVVLPLLVVILAVAGVLLVLAGVAAIVCSPLLLSAAFVWLLWRLSRPRRTAATMRA